MSETWDRSSGHLLDLPQEQLSSSPLNLEARPFEDLVQEPEVAEVGVVPLAEELPGAADEQGARMSCRYQNWAAYCWLSCSFPLLAGYPLPDQMKVHLYLERLLRSRMDCSWKHPLAAQEAKEMTGKMQGSVLWQ